MGLDVHGKRLELDNGATRELVGVPLAIVMMVDGRGEIAVGSTAGADSDADPEYHLILSAAMIGPGFVHFEHLANMIEFKDRFNQYSCIISNLERYYLLCPQ